MEVRLQVEVKVMRANLTRPEVKVAGNSRGISCHNLFESETIMHPLLLHTHARFA